MSKMQPAYTPIYQRPRMPEARPHTVHAASSSTAEYDANMEMETDDQATPRASLVSLGSLNTLAENVLADRRLSRDDTAADMSEMLMDHDAGANNATSSRMFPEPTAFGGLNSSFNKWLTSDSFSQYRNSGPDFRVVHIEPPENTCIDPQLLSNTQETSSSTHPKQARSLGRRFSRSYKEKVNELKDTVSKHTPRMRRASTPHHNQEGATRESVADHRLPSYSSTSGIAPPPLSPSKRNARYGDPRLKKFRSAFGVGGSGDRKDTPAPPAASSATFSMAQRPAPRHAARVLPQCPIQGAWVMPGGEGARNHAAMFRADFEHAAPASFLNQLSDANDTFYDAPDEHEYDSRRARLGSNSTAADSGADLSNTLYPDNNSCKDSTADSEDPASPMDLLPMELPDHDFVSSRILPYEVCLQIFEYLDKKELGRARQVNSNWRALANKKSVWRAAYMRKYGREIFTDPPPIQIGGVGVGRPNKPKQKWEKMYKAREELERNWKRGPQEAGKAIYLSGHTDSVYCLQFDEEKIITGSRDRTIRVWDINTFQCIKVIGGPAVRPSLGPKLLRTVDYPSFHLATASVNGTAYGNNIFNTPAQWHDASILCLQYDDKILVTGSSDSDLLIWDVKTYEPIRRLRRHNGGVLDVALDAKHIISCSKDSRIIVWDRETYQPKGELSGHRGPVNAIQLRGHLLVSASGDGIARLWDIEAMKLVKEFSAKERGLAAVEFSEDMRYVLAGGNDHITYKFDVKTGEEVAQFTGHTQLVRSLWLDSANNRVVSGSYDLDLRVYDFATGQETWRAEEWTTSWMLAAKSDYRRIVATSQDGRILVIDFGLKKGGQEDGQPIDNVELLRGVENTNEVKFRNPWQPKVIESDDED